MFQPIVLRRDQWPQKKKNHAGIFASSHSLIDSVQKFIARNPEKITNYHNNRVMGLRTVMSVMGVPEADKLSKKNVAFEEVLDIEKWSFL